MSQFGSPLLPKRFWGKVIQSYSGCWIWTGARRQGYGQVWQGGSTVATHRLAYEALVGPIPVGLHVDHLCRNAACCNPEHLEPVTPRENTLRGEGLAAKYAGATHCIRGHEFTDENTGQQHRGRYCIQCRRDWNREHKRTVRDRAKVA